MKKIICLLLTTLMLFTLCACKPPKEDDDIDPTKTQIYIAIGDSGVGTDFLYNLKTAYEAYNNDVQIIIKQRDSELANGLDYMKSTTEDILYVNTNGQSDLSPYERYMMDLTQLIDIKAYDESGEYVVKGNGVKSLKDKMLAYENNYNMLNQGTKENPKFLSLPWFNAVYGLWYDIDLFESEHLYDLPGYKGLDGIEGTEDDNYGPDGLPDTFDDGLPATWEDMKILLDEMAGRNIVPFTFSGMHTWMRNYFLDLILMNYEGMDDYALNYSFSGTDSDFGKIDETNGYLLKQQEGKKAMLLVAEKIAKDGLYSNGSMKTTQTHLQAQIEYLDSATTDMRGAFLIDGSWWEYEARDTFDRMAKINKKFARGTRRFGYFPIPRFIGTEGLKDQQNTTRYVRDISTYSIVVNANTKVKEEIEDFLLFAHSQTSLVNFTKTTNLFCSYEYDMGDDLKSLTPLAQSVYALLRDENTETYYAGVEVLSMNGGTALDGQLSLRGRNNAFFDQWEYLTKVGGDNYNDPIRNMAYDERNALTADSWFKGYADACSKETWESYFG